MTNGYVADQRQESQGERTGSYRNNRGQKRTLRRVSQLFEAVEKGAFQNEQVRSLRASRFVRNIDSTGLWS